MMDLIAADFANWQDRRLSEVPPGSVIRDMNLLSAVLTVCVKEWGLLARSPMARLAKPRAPESKSRKPSKSEMEALAISAGADLTNATARAFHAFLFAIETGMRAGEIFGPTKDRIDTTKRVARLDMTKSGTARDVPLSTEAVLLLEALPKADPIFGLDSHQPDALWRKVRDRVGVIGLTFHDSRHEAIMRPSKKLDVLALARLRTSVTGSSQSSGFAHTRCAAGARGLVL